MEGWNGECSGLKERETPQKAVGLSPSPTLYRLRWRNGAREGEREYVRCGADLLLSGLTGDLESEAHCPICGSPTRLTIVDRKIHVSGPKGALLHVVEMPGESGWISIECGGTHIFDREACLQKWVSTYKGKQGLVTSIEKYHDVIRRRRTDPKKIVPITQIKATRVQPLSERESSESN